MVNSNSYTGFEIAVIGMSCRFPGANNIHQFWDDLKNGTESISFFSKEELIEAGINEKFVESPNYIKAEGCIKDKDNFDLSFFGYLHEEARMMDPQIRIFHECVWEAIEDAAYNPFDFKGLIGLFAGAGRNFYWEAFSLNSNKNRSIDNFTVGLLANKDSLTTRISYKLNLKGPSFSVNTACSTSLVAIHIACQSLLSGECDIAVAGGVKIISSLTKGYLYQEGMINSKDGHCRAFDVGASGLVGGEGAACVVLKPLENALEDFDNIYAIIKGSFINNDGVRKVGYTAPSVEGQAEVIKNALAIAKVPLESICCIETHGTGTALGDSIEVEALKNVFGSGGKKYCGIGSVKTNIGHLDTAAGVAGFIKTVLALKKKKIPPSLHFRKTNPKIDLNDGPFYVNNRLKDWRNDNFPMRAGVSSFGIGGTNAHIVLEEAPVPGEVTGPTRDYKLIMISALTETALKKAVGNLVKFFRTNPEINLSDVSYTLQVGRKSFGYRKMCVCSDVSEAIDALSSSGSRGIRTFFSKKEKPTVFMFSGLGSQYLKMGFELYKKEVVFRTELDRCFKILHNMTGQNFKNIYFPGEYDREKFDIDIHDIETAQQLIFIFEFSLAKLLINWGIKPDAMIGYSFGEYICACIAGVFSLEDALKLVLYRGKLIKETSTGAMLGVPISRKKLQPLLSEGLNIAVDNGASCIVSGAEKKIDAFAAQMRKRKYLCFRLKTGYAVHSIMMEPILRRFERYLDRVTLNNPCIPYISNVTGDWIKENEATDPRYWACHMRKTVRFSEGIDKLIKEGEYVFIEIGPGHDLGALILRFIEDKPSHQVVDLVKTEDKEISDVHYLLIRIGELWTYGVTLDWESFYKYERRRRVSLPTYAFDKIHFPVYEGFPNMISGLKSNSLKNGTKELSNWFYIPSWKQRENIKKRGDDKQADLTWLIFMDTNGLGRHIADQLKEQHVVLVEIGEEYKKKSKFEYSINPQSFSDYNTLLQELDSEELIPDQIVHSWTIADICLREEGLDFIERDLELGFYSILYLTRALGKNRNYTKEIQINIITNNMQEVIGDEYLNVSMAAVLGICKVIPQEFPNLNCKSIDILQCRSGDWHDRGIIGKLIKEITLRPANLEVAFRGSHRWERVYDPVQLDGNREPILLKEEGVYLIIGGLGDIGFTLAEYLITTFRAKIILTGRSELPLRERWEHLLRINNKSDKGVRKIKRLQKLEEYGDRVLYCSIDIGDKRQMQDVVDLVEKRFGKINGVIHSAGIIEGKSFAPIETISKSACHLQFQAKLYGTLVLDELFQDKELDFCLLISSIASILGGLGFAAYSAANNLMDAFARKVNQKKREPWIIVNWDGTNRENTVNAFRRILSVDYTGPILFSVGGDIEGRLSSWIKLAGLKNGTDKKQNESEMLYSRPELLNPYVAPETDLEKKLIDIWQNFFAIERIGVTDDLFDLGGDSLKAINLLSLIHKRLNVKISIGEFFKYSTIRGIVRYIEKVDEEEYISINPVEKKEYYALSSAQKRLYITQQMEPGSITYNTPQIVELEIDVDVKRLKDIFGKLIRRHEALRTSFELIEDEPQQRIYTDFEFEMDYFVTGAGDEVELNGKCDLKNLITAIIKPFDLSQAPLLRGALIRVGNEKHLLVADIHHIITDGISNAILVTDLLALFSGRDLPLLMLQYKDYSEWQNGRSASKGIEMQEQYWLKVFEDGIVELNMPTDFQRLDKGEFAGDFISFIINEEVCKKLKKFTKKTGTTLYMILLAIFYILLHKYTGQEDIVVGSPITGRPHNDLQNIFGMFVNMMPVRNSLNGGMIFRDFLEELKQNALNAYENQDYQFEELVKKLGLQRNSARNPLFDVVFAMQTMAAKDGDARIIGMSPAGYEFKISRFDIVFFVSEFEKTIGIKVQYKTSLFKKVTIEKIKNHFIEIQEQILDNAYIKLQDIIISHDLLFGTNVAQQDEIGFNF